MKTFKQVDSIDCLCEETYKDLEITEAEYQGKKVKLKQKIRQVQDTGHVINGEQTHLSITNSSFPHFTRGTMISRRF